MNKIIKISLIVSSLLFAQAVFAAEQSTAKSNDTVQATAATTTNSAAASTAQVNINSADAATLSKELNGIGEVKAKAIVEYRTQNGPFKTVDDLAKVNGIGAATIEKNKNKMVLQ